MINARTLGLARPRPSDARYDHSSRARSIRPSEIGSPAFAWPRAPRERQGPDSSRLKQRRLARRFASVFPRCLSGRSVALPEELLAYQHGPPSVDCSASHGGSLPSPSTSEVAIVAPRPPRGWTRPGLARTSPETKSRADRIDDPSRSALATTASCSFALRCRQGDARGSRRVPLPFIALSQARALFTNAPPSGTTATARYLFVGSVNSPARKKARVPVARGLTPLLARSHDDFVACAR